MTSSTPFTDVLKQRFADIESHSQYTSGTPSASISPQGTPRQHQSAREGSVGWRENSPMNEADPTGKIVGTAIVDGHSDLAVDAHGVVTDGAFGAPRFKYVGASLGGSSLGESSFNTNNNYNAPHFNSTTGSTSFGSSATGAAGGGVNNNNNNNNRDLGNTSGINQTPRYGASGNEGPGGGAGVAGGGGAGGRPLGGARNNQQQQQGGVPDNFVGAGASARSIVTPGAGDGLRAGRPLYHATASAAAAAAAGAGEGPYNLGATYYPQHPEEGSEDEEESEFDSDEEEPDVMPKRYRPQVKSGPLAGSDTKGRGIGLNHSAAMTAAQEHEAQHEAILAAKGEFLSYDLVTALLEAGGNSIRRDLVEYHTPIPFLQFLEQMMCGAYFIKFHPRHGTPHERYFYLRMIEVEPGVERPFFCQCKHATAVQIDDAVAVADLVGVVAGDDSPSFQRQMVSPGFVKGSFVGARRPNFSTKGALSLYFYDRKRQHMPRSLDVLTTNMTVFKLWKVTCEALVAVNTVKMGPHAQNAAQHMRAYFVAAMRAIKEQARAAGVKMSSS